MYFSLFYSEIIKFGEILKDYKRYEKLLFRLSPSEWQQAQRTKALKAKVPSDGHAQDKQSREPEESGKCLIDFKTK